MIDYASVCGRLRVFMPCGVRVRPEFEWSQSDTGAPAELSCMMFVQFAAAEGGSCGFADIEGVVLEFPGDSRSADRWAAR